MRVLITGGTGFVGRATVRALVEAGHEVLVLARDEARAREAFAPETSQSQRVEIRAGDPSDTDAVGAALEGRDGAALRVGVRVVDVSSQVVFALGLDTVGPTTPLVKPGEPGWGDPYSGARSRPKRPRESSRRTA